MQHHFVERDAFAEVHLHPFRSVRRGGDSRMPAILRREAARRLAQTGDGFIQRHEGLAGQRPGFCLNGVRLRLLRLPHRFQSRALPGDSRINVIAPVRAVQRGEDRLEVVVFRLLDRIELVIVALRAVYCQRAEGVHRVRHHVIAVEVPRHLAVNFVFRHFRMADEIPRPGGDESQGLDAIARPGKQRIAR